MSEGKVTELFHVFSLPVTHGDVVYRAEVHGRRYTESLWEGWVEFVALPSGDRLRSPRETTQPTREALEYWSEGLSPVYLAGALERAIALSRLADGPGGPSAGEPR